MAFPTTLAACSTNPASNGPQGTDLPSELDDAQRQAFAFFAQLRDGAGIPTGVALPWLTSAAAPTGWLKLNGSLVSRATYANLFAFATAAGLVSEAAWTGGQYGCFSVGDGSTTFRLPDWRGMFIRGLDESRGIDAGRALGVFQDHGNVSHNHGVNDPTHAHGVSDPSHAHAGATDAQGNHAHGYTGWAATAAGASTGFQLVYAPSGAATDAAGIHAHNFNTDARFSNISIFGNPTGISIQAQGGEGRPKNLPYPHIIKF